MKSAKLARSPALAGGCNPIPQIPSYLRVHFSPLRPGQKTICNSSSNNGNGASSSAENDSRIWKESAFPQYLQEDVNSSDFCTIWEEAKAAAGTTAANSKDSSLWRSIRREAETDAREEPLLSSFLYASILSHESFERSLAFVLANRLSDATLLSTELFEVFHQVLRSHHEIAAAAMADLSAIRERDPACCSYSQALLHFKGYHAIQAHRIAHCLWHQGRRVMAFALQSRSSEVFAVDIHPAAQIGKGVLLDHGTGVVIGETAEIGNNVSILHNVTLGGTGKQHGDRHPKVSDNVLIGASATILGNIRIGKGAQVAAGSLVLKAVPPRTMVAGSPAKEVGKVYGNPAQKMDQWSEGATKETSILRDPCDDLFAAPAGSAVKMTAPLAHFNPNGSTPHAVNVNGAAAAAAAAHAVTVDEHNIKPIIPKEVEKKPAPVAEAKKVEKPPPPSPPPPSAPKPSSAPAASKPVFKAAPPKPKPSYSSDVEYMI